MLIIIDVCFIRLNVGELGVVDWKLIYFFEFLNEFFLDLLYFGIVGGVWWLVWCVGLDGVEIVKRSGCFGNCCVMSFFFELWEVGEDRGGVIGVLFDVLRGGRFVGMEEVMLCRKGSRRYEEGLLL